MDRNPDTLSVCEETLDGQNFPQYGADLILILRSKTLDLKHTLSIVPFWHHIHFVSIFGAKLAPLWKFIQKSCLGKGG